MEMMSIGKDAHDKAEALQGRAGPGAQRRGRAKSCNDGSGAALR